MNASPQHHPDKNLLVEFAAGTLAPAQAIAISAHLHYCVRCRNEVATLEAVGGALLSITPEQTPKNTDATPMPSFDDLMTRIDEQDKTTTTVKNNSASLNASNEATQAHPALHQKLPRAVSKMLRNKPIQWKRVTAELKSSSLTAGQDQYAVSLQKIAAGGKVPEHDHRGSEMTVVLKGSFSDEDNAYQLGDFLLKNPGDIHRPMSASNEDCLCLAVEEAPVKLTGLLTRLLNPFLRIRAA